MFALMVLVAMAVPIVAFWNAPQEQLRADYGYGAEKKRRKRTLADDDQDALPIDP